MNKSVEILHEKIQLFELVNDASIDGIIVCDKKLKVDYCNRTSEILTGIKKEAAEGRMLFDLFPWFNNNPFITNSVSKVFRGIKVFISYENAGKPDLYNEYHLVPLQDEVNSVTGILVIIHDVAHRIKAEQQLRRLNDSLTRRNQQLKIKNAELAYFSKGAGYDLNEPLSRINAIAELLITKQHTNIELDVSGYLKRIQNNANKVSILSAGLRAYYDVCSSNFTASNFECYNALLLASQSVADKHHFKELISIPSPLPVIRGDRSLITLLFQNLISNSVKFQKEDTKPLIIIKARTVSGSETGISEAADRSYWRIDFADNGIGMDMANADVIFQLFQRLNNDKYPGAGIGLAVCRKIMDQHNGFITVSSQEGVGSTFYIFIPVAEV